jgi:hypothetical protein
MMASSLELPTYNEELYNNFYYHNDFHLEETIKNVPSPSPPSTSSP